MDDSDVSEDDVVFEGSPLHASLMAAGVPGAEYETEARFTPDTANGCPGPNIESADSISFKTMCIGSRLMQAWTTLWTRVLQAILALFPTRPLYRDADRYDLLTTAHLMKCDLLEEEDANFLQRYMEVAACPLDVECEDITPSKWSAILGLPCLTVYAGYRMYGTPPHLLYTATDYLALVAGLWLLCTACLTLLAQRHSHRHRARNHIALRFVRVGEDLLDCLRRSLRLIQERELVARGFTLVSQRVPASRLEIGATTQRQCPELRHLVFTTARDALLAVREATQRLIQLQPLSAELDIHSSYLAFDPLGSYGPCLQIPTDDPAATAHLCDLTDGFSVSAIKGMVGLLSIHQSELLKRLTLVFYFKGLQKVAVDMAATTTLLQQLSDHVQQQAGSVRRLYDIHHCTVLDPAPATPPKAPRARPSPHSDAIVALHSLDLHLQAALTRVRSLSSALDKLRHDGGDTVTDPAADDTLTTNMAAIKAELDASRGCWEEGLLCVERLQNKQHTVAADVTSARTAGGDSEGPTDGSSSHTTARPIEEYIVLDQVFEAYTDPGEADPEDTAWHEFLSPEDKEKKKREKEEALRLLTELKSVISVRAVQRQLRELDAIRRDNPQVLKQTAVPQPETSHLEPNLIGQPEAIMRDNPKVLGQTADSHQEITHLEPNLIEAAEADSSSTERTYSEAHCNAVHSDSDGIDSCSKAGNFVEEFSKESSEPVEVSDSCIKAGNIVEYIKETCDSIEVTDSGVKAGTNTTEYSSKETSEHGPTSSEHAEHAVIERASDSGSEVNSDDGNESPTFRLPSQTLQARLSYLTGADLQFSSDIAALAVARSRTMGQCEETTFGDDSDDSADGGS